MDAGCKFGDGAKYLSVASQSVDGVDIDEERIQKCPEVSNCNFIASSLEEPLEGEYDVVICFETLEHLERPELFLSQLPKILKGKFIFSVPIGDRLRVDGSRIEEHVRIFESEIDVLKLLKPYMDVVFLSRQEPMSFIGIGIV